MITIIINLRSNKIDYILNKTKTNFNKKASAIQVQNELPGEMKGNCLSLNAFKTLLRDRPQNNT